MSDVFKLTWEVGHGPTAEAQPERFVPATVPGAVQLDWAAAEGWGDPHYGDNWRQYGWMEDVWWTYRTTVPETSAREGHSLFFVCGGVDYECIVRLNGEILQHHVGMFSPMTIDLTKRAHTGDVLTIQVFPAPKSQSAPADRSQANQSCKPAVAYDWDFHPRLIPLGIWQPATLELRPALHLTDAEVFYELDDALATATVRMEANMAEAGEGRVRWQLLDPDEALVFETEGVVDGDTFTCETKLESPRLWWPHDQGEPALYRSITETLSLEDVVIDRRESRVGFRRVSLVMHEGAWDHPEGASFPKSRSHPPITLEINGRHIFAKGSNWVCPDIFPGRLTRERYREQLELARDTNFNLLRCWGGAIVPHRCFYEICDELGLMVWAEFPLACNRYEGTPEYLSILDQESRSIIAQLRPHTSVVLWCGGNELFNAWSGMTDQDLPLRLLNSNCYDLDPHRPFLPTAPVAGMGHGHYAFRDAAGDEVFQLFARAQCTAYTEFGCPGPSDEETLRAIIPEDDLFPPRPGTAWETHHALGAWGASNHLTLDIIEDYFGPCQDLTQLVTRGQLLQGEGLKCLYEEARRQKPRASMALNWCFNEPWPAAANMSLLSWPTRAKPALAEVRAACRPVLASARLSRFVWKKGTVFSAELWLLNDSPQPIEGGEMQAVLLLDGKEHSLLRWDFPNTPANTNRIGPTARITLPSAPSGSMTLKLRVKGKPEWCSSYIVMFEALERAEDLGTRRLNT